MPKLAKELGPLAVKRLTAHGRHAVGGVSGLALQVTETGARTWVLRTMIGGKRCELGLGAFPGVPLADARTKASALRAQVGEGADPVQERKRRRSALAAERAGAQTFRQCAEAYVASHAAGWRSEKHAAQWTATLHQYAYPVIGDLLVQDVERAHVLRILEPIWTTKTETASRVRGRIETVLSWAVVRGFRPEGENPARWRGLLENALPRPAKVAAVEHHRAVALDDMPAFMERLGGMDGMGARALEFAILTAARSGEVRGATWGEIDLPGKVWTVPAERMKGGR